MSLFILAQAAIGTPALIGIFALVAFLVVYAIRKKFGKQWEKLALLIPGMSFDMGPGMVIVSKFLQMLPATLIGAALGAVTSGGSLVPTLLAALAGPLAALGHELAKAVPIIPYRGETNLEPKIPGPPKLPTGLTIMAIAFMFGGCASALPQTCTPTDIEMATHAYECRERVKNECKGVPDSECPAIKECDDWGKNHCA